MRDAKENHEKKLAALHAPMHGHFFLAVFFRIMHDGLSERGTTPSLVASTIVKLITTLPSIQYTVPHECTAL